jgi:Amt family ammonium transporter
LVAITPGCVFVAPWAAVLIGLVAGVLCSLSVGLKYKFNYDDSLDVVGVHLVGGLWGTLAIGFFGTTAATSWGANGLFYGGGTELLVKQATGAFSVLIFSFVATYIIGMLLEKTIGFRISRDEEIEGVDITSHAESSYELDSRSGGGAFGGLLAGNRSEG